MTSRALFFKLMKEELRHKIWLIALSMLFFFIAMPLNIGMNNNRIFRQFSYIDSNGNRLHDALAYNYLTELGFSYTVMTFIIIAGVIIGIAMFAYSFSRKKVDFYHSLPVSRTVFFTMKYISGLFIFLGTFLINLVIALLIGIIIGVPVFSALPALLYILLGHLLGFFITYTMAVCCTLLCGNLVVSGLLLLLLSLLPYAVISTTASLAERYFLTYSRYNTTFKSFLTSFSPIWRYTDFYKDIEFMPDLTFTPSASKLIYLLAALLLLGTAAYLLFRFRPSEAAGAALAFRKSIPPLRFISVVILSLLTGIMFSEMSTNNSQDFWRIFGFAFGFLLAWMIINTIIYFDFKKSFAKPLQMGFAALAVILTFCTFTFDWTGYDKYQPKLKNIAGIGINLPNLENTNCYWTGNDTDSYYSYEGHSYSAVAATKAMQLKPELVYDLTTELINLSPVSNFSSLPYHTGNFSYTSCLVKYELKSGRTVYRSYPFPVAAEYLDWIKTIYNDSDYKQITYPFLSLEQPRLNSASIVGRDYQPLRLTLSQAELNELYTLCQDAYLSLKADQLISDCPVGQIRFTYYEEITNPWSNPNLGSICEFIYPAFTEVISFLEQHGAHFDISTDNIDSLVVSKPKNVQGIYANRYDYDIPLEEYQKKYGISPIPSPAPRATMDSFPTKDTYENDDYIVITYYDQESIRAILSACVPEQYVYTDTILQPQISDSLITITQNVDEYGNKVRYQYRIPEDMIPKFLVEDLKTP